MKLFRLAAGTEVLVHDQQTSSIGHYDVSDEVLTRELIFELEDMVIDPIGAHSLAIGPQNDVVIGGAYAKAGYYGFSFEPGVNTHKLSHNKRYTVLVPGDRVEVL